MQVTPEDYELRMPETGESESVFGAPSSAPCQALSLRRKPTQEEHSSRSLAAGQEQSSEIERAQL